MVRKRRYFGMDGVLDMDELTTKLHILAVLLADANERGNKDLERKYAREIMKIGWSLISRSTGVEL